MYPQATEDDFSEFERGLSNMAGHKQYKDAQYIDVLDMFGGGGPDGDNPGTEPDGTTPDQE
jgi:hypothetical protein